ncbi:guanylate cyclase [Malaciobacter pacificus]|jgi:hypothetical protein|uniref:Heme NO binding domain-containing protein n=1 Tax=Malaciobacter pacificus TaxID=1080223 RepID=A0A5C2H5Y6_9BACT|nr:heme NO-binding domain-containing protein [Malaciobacter pacificus]QEP33769.1 Heme NO binding domain-containing protein [Malaciobacter pacificus]GGD33166.1 guanylate cyclase [Malaciobacter pacificus]
MKGIVFTELIEFVEDALGFDVADKMIEKAKLENDGAFTQGGNYPFSQMLKLLGALSEITAKKPNELLFIFGKHLFSVLVKLYNKDIQKVGGALEFIDSVEQLVHVEVKKLYPDVDLPTFQTVSKDENSMVLVYKSEKRLESFAHGLMIACGEYFNENLDISYKTISQEPYEVQFNIKKS